MLLKSIPTSWGRTKVLGSVRKIARVRPHEIGDYQNFITKSEDELSRNGLSPVTTGLFTNDDESIVGQIVVGVSGHTMTSMGVLIRSESDTRAFVYQAERDRVDEVVGRIRSHLAEVH